MRGGFLTIVDESAPVQAFASHAHVYVIDDVPNDLFSLNVTLVWRDPPGEPGSPIARVNDLNLSAESVGGTQPVFYVGNAGLVGDPELITNWSYAFGPNEEVGPWDSVNTVENIFIQNPSGGRWQFIVSAPEVCADAYAPTPEWDVPYSLVVSVDFDCDNNGVPDSEESGPIHALGCSTGGSGGSGSNGGNPIPPEMPGCELPSGAQ